MKFDFTREPGRKLWKNPSDIERKAFISIITPCEEVLNRHEERIQKFEKKGQRWKLRSQ